MTILSEGDHPGDVGVTDEARMQINLPVTAPGTAVQVSFPNQEMRAPAFTLERFDAGMSEPRVWTAQEFMRRGVECEPRFTGPEPHPVTVPDSARLGTYRGCTVGLPEKLCAEFDVARP